MTPQKSRWETVTSRKPQERELYRYYGLDYADQRSDSGIASGQALGPAEQKTTAQRGTGARNASISETGDGDGTATGHQGEARTAEPITGGRGARFPRLRRSDRPATPLASFREGRPRGTRDDPQILQMTQWLDPDRVVLLDD